MQRVLVTAGASGIGYALAEAFYAEGYKVWIIDVSENDLKKPEDFINHSLYLESKTFLHGLLVVEDKLSMSHGLETRIPFLDNDLVDFALQCPVKLKINKF